MPPATQNKTGTGYTTGGPGSTAGRGAADAAANAAATEAATEKKSRKGMKRGDVRPIYVLYKGDVSAIKLARNAAAVLKLAEQDKDWKWMSLVVEDGKAKVGATSEDGTDKAMAQPGDTVGVA